MQNPVGHLKMADPLRMGLARFTDEAFAGADGGQEGDSCGRCGRLVRGVLSRSGRRLSGK
jgi:hypothetical protein